MGAHAIHVGIGLVGIAYLIFKSYANKFTPQSHTAVELIGIYWVFVDIVWLILFPLFYLI
jgi:heme/copper-type cytochrome/quinol oxidase subunit 3